jgi:hypothetical protein
MSAAWDFGDNPDSGGASDFADDYGQGTGAFTDFGDEVGRDDAENSLVDALVANEPAQPVDTGTAIDALPADAGDLGADDAEDDDDIGPTATVTNPAETVSVTATMDGRVSMVELSGAAANMTESGLADEIFAIADLARQRALSMQHSFVLESFRLMGLEDDGVVAEALENGVTGLRSPQQATQAQADVFATRYANVEDAK